MRNSTRRVWQYFHDENNQNNKGFRDPKILVVLIVVVVKILPRVSSVPHTFVEEYQVPNLGNLLNTKYLIIIHLSRSSFQSILMV